MRVHNLSDPQITILLKVRRPGAHRGGRSEAAITETREIALPVLQSNPAC